jgi:hypothetical protein
MAGFWGKFLKSAIAPKADIDQRLSHVRFVPIPDIFLKDEPDSNSNQKHGQQSFLPNSQPLSSLSQETGPGPRVSKKTSMAAQVRCSTQFSGYTKV